MSQPPPQADIHLPQPATWQPPPMQPRRGMPNWVLAVVAAVFTAAALGTWFAVPESTAEAAVRSFLEEVRDGEVESALEWLEETRPNPFLTAEALDPNWEITDIAQVAYGNRGAESAAVYAEIEAYDGTRLGHRFTVDLRGESPRIIGGTTRPMNHGDDPIEINGFTAPNDAVTLLPGVYHFYESAPTTLDFRMPPVLVLGLEIVELGGDTAIKRIGYPEPELTDSGAEQLDATLREFLDECAQTRARECPIGVEHREDRLSEADPQAPWRIVDYPTASLGRSFDFEGTRLETTDPGRAEFEAVIDGATTTVACTIWVDGLAADVDWDSGAVTVDTGHGTVDRCEHFTEAG